MIKKYRLMAMLLSLLLLAGASCNKDTTKNDADIVTPEDDIVVTEAETIVFDDAVLIENEGAAIDDVLIPDSDIDMFCPPPAQAGYPYYRENGSVHYCRPCDFPVDDFDPDCVRALWDIWNKKIYDFWLAGEFENNQNINECYPYPCEWNVKPTTPADDPELHQCDIRLNPDGWPYIYPSGPQQVFMSQGKVGMYILNNDINDKIGGTMGRHVQYDIQQKKYKVLGMGMRIFAMASDKLLGQYYAGDSYSIYTVSLEDGPSGAHYDAIYSPPQGEIGNIITGTPALSDRWAIIITRKQVNPDIFKTSYGSLSDGKWQVIIEGSEGYINNTAIVGDKAMFYDRTTKESYLCDLSKTPKSVTDCIRLGREGEVATFALFNRTNPNEVLYWVFKEEMPGTEYIILDISTTPFTVKKSFTVSPTEPTFTRQMVPIAYDGTILFYSEEFMNQTGTQYDKKLCFYRMDEEKTYCSKKRTLYGNYGGLQGYGSWEGKYLLWQGYTVPGFYLRDMECYCQVEGDADCPFPEYRSSNRMKSVPWWQFWKQY